MGLLVAVLVFVAVVGIVGTLHASTDEVDAFVGEPRRVPNPSPRDIHATTGMLGRAPVPRWG
jgi:hypothetical protein